MALAGASCYLLEQGLLRRWPRMFLVFTRAPLRFLHFSSFLLLKRLELAPFQFKLTIYMCRNVRLVFPKPLIPLSSALMFALQLGFP